jgi:hypothetical protein
MQNDIVCGELARSIKKLKAQIAAIRKTHPHGVPPELQDLLDQLADAESVFQRECTPAAPPLARFADIKFDLRSIDPPASGSTFSDPNEFFVETAAGNTVILQVTATAPAVPGQADTDIVYIGNSLVPPLTLSPPNVFQVLPQGQAKTATLTIQIPSTTRGSFTVEIAALVLNEVGKIGTVHVNLLFPLKLDGIEVTQAIQDMNHSVKLIAGKAGVVRVYLSYPNQTAITVRGELALQRSPGGGSLIIPSLNTVVLDPSQVGRLDTKRQNISLSLNFLLPSNQTTDGALFITLASLTDTGTGRPVDVSQLNARINVTFTASPPLRIRILGIRYISGSPPAFQVPSVLDFGLINSWLKRAYPIAEVISSQAIVDANATPPFSCDQINAQIAAIRALDMSGGADKRTHYFGLVSDGGGPMMRGCSAIPASPDPSAVGSGPTGAGTWGWDFDGSYGDWYTGHELGHTFGRLHPGSGCGETSDDPNYPFPAGQLARADDAFVGLDVGDPAFNLPMVALPGTLWHDVMTYCQKQWVSSYTYEGIRARLAAEDAMGSGALPDSGSGLANAGAPDRRFPERVADAMKAGPGKQLVSVVATVNLTKPEGKIKYVNPVHQGDVSPVDPDSPVILYVKRADGILLHAYQVSVKPFSCQSPGNDRLALVDALIGLDPGARMIELSVAGQVVDTFRAGARPPAVHSLKHVSSQANALSLAWETNASADDNHSYIVQTSTDQGRTWQTLAVGLDKPEVVIDHNQFYGAKHLLVRVISTDGFTSSVVTSESLPVDSSSGAAPSPKPTRR